MSLTHIFLSSTENRKGKKKKKSKESSEKVFIKRKRNERIMHLNNSGTHTLKKAAGDEQNSCLSCVIL